MNYIQQQQKYFGKKMGPNTRNQESIKIDEELFLADVEELHCFFSDNILQTIIEDHLA
jgi:hypothetical protein